jgi:hypothetical protein
MGSSRRPIQIRPDEKQWLHVTVLDHPGLEDYVPSGPATVLLRRDWEFLFEQLKSTYAVMEYLRRISSDEPMPLGEEPVRYYQLAAADAATPPSQADSRLVQLGLKSESLPLLPQAPAGHSDDPYHIVIRAVLEDIATSPLPDDASPGDLLDVLAAIDATPVAYRADLGRMWLGWLREVADTDPSMVTWRFRSHIWPDRPYLLFGAAPRHSQIIQHAFGTYVRLRHRQHLDILPDRAGMLTVGVVLTPRFDGRRPWDTTVVATDGDQEFDAEDRAALEQLWGKLGESRPPIT